MTSLGKFLDTLRAVHLHTVYKKVEGFIPHWLNSRIKSIVNKHRFTPLVIAEEIQPKYEMACNFLIKRLGKNALGDYLEFGVSHGSSLGIMHKVLKNLELDHVRIFGFDSFEGMPEIAANEDDGRWQPGDFSSSIKATSEFLTKQGVDWTRTFLIKGWFSDTLSPETVKKHSIKKASVIMIDCDIYTSSIQALNFCKPFVTNTAIVLFDDWIEDKEVGECRAWTEFLQENPNFQSEHFGSYNPSGKIFILTNPNALGRR